MAFRIETERLLIREWSANKAEWNVIAGWTRNPDMTRYVTGEDPWTDKQVDEFFARQEKLLKQAGVCFGAVEEKTSGMLVGLGGIAPMDRVEDYQIGWWIDPEWQGRGLASEMARAFIRYSLEQLNLPRVLAVFYEDNIASRRVMEKAGMRFLDRVPGDTLESRWNSAESVVYVADK